MIAKLVNRIKRKWTKFRLQPIRVFCFHHVSDEYDPLTMWEEDWTQTDVLKKNIMSLKESGVEFISLTEAHEKLKHDWFRTKKYAVMTADDGYKSLLNILPWLEEQKIPITLFVNPKYITKGGIGENILNRLNKAEGNVNITEIYLNITDIDTLRHSNVTFAYHGHEHIDEYKADQTTFAQNLSQCINAMEENFPNVIPFYAHTYGHAKLENDKLLRAQGIIPVYTSGNRNFNNTSYIDRELISNERQIKNPL